MKMLSSSLSYILVRSFPECILMLISSYLLLNIDFKLREIIKKSIVFVLIVLAIRMLPISFGIHTILSMFVLGIILYKFKNQNIINTILTISKMFVCLVISEGIYTSIVTGIFKLPVEILMDNTNIKSALLTIPSLLIFLILVFIVKKIDLKMTNNKSKI